MIIYENTKGGFIQDVRSGRIASSVKTQFERHGIYHNNDAEFRAWSNSLLYMRNVLDDDQIPDDRPSGSAHRFSGSVYRQSCAGEMGAYDQTSSAQIFQAESDQWF